MAIDAQGLSRRVMLQSIAATTMLLAALARTPSWARGAPAELDGWAHNLLDLNHGLERGDLSVVEWQDRVAALNAAVPVGDLVHYLDIDEIAGAFRYPTLLAEIAEPSLPAQVLPDGRGRRWFLRLFGMRRGGAIIPHVHNNMVSAHLVISGRFHARTHHRIADQDGAVLLRPSMDRTIAVGDIITMSDQRDNAHWLVAETDRSMTFDVGVVDLPASWTYGHKANAYQIFIDPDRNPERNGVIVAPVMSFEDCSAKFAAA
jgi:hypothetical protein